MKRRLKIRLISFAAAVFSAMLIWGITETVTAKNYETLVRISRQRALEQMCEYLDNIETDLAKAQYATGSSMLNNLSVRMLREASGAKTSLSALESGEVGLYNIYKFLSQVGEYTAHLSRKAAAAEEISEEDRQILSNLTEYAASLSTQFDLMSELNNSNYFTFDELNSTLDAAQESSEQMVSYINAVGDAEQSFSDYPTLIYDGPYADNKLNSVSALLENEKELSNAAAKRAAADVLGISEDALVADGVSGGEIPTYDFYCDTVYVSVSKKGGYPVYILSDAVVGEAKISEKEAVSKAEDFLEKIGFDNMEETYYYTTDGVCTINFAYEENDFVCYPDLIKVSISLFDGKVTSMDATDYLMNHTERAFPTSVADEKTASAAIAPSLKIKDTGLAVIPTDTGKEKFVYEFLCAGTDGQEMLIYVDMLSLEEADILILLYSDNGTLTR
ncbi:MAG: germination protein YpeB [Clostridia bacterium]|nr:germination protein YpeB [Clostridia bacterium]